MFLDILLSPNEVTYEVWEDGNFKLFEGSLEECEDFMDSYVKEE